MNVKLKITAAFAAGIGCGVLATYSFFKEKYRKITEEEFESMRKFVEKQKEKDETKRKNDISDKSSIVEMERKSNELVNYNNLTDNYISSVPPNDKEIENRINRMHEKMEELAENEHPEEETDEQFEITSADWLDDPFFDKIILTYYTGDDTVANEAGLIDDVDMSIGTEQFELFKNSDDLERYIRNPALGIDYNIVKDTGCYHV